MHFPMLPAKSINAQHWHPPDKAQMLSWGFSYLSLTAMTERQDSVRQILTNGKRESSPENTASFTVLHGKKQD